jgi:NADPH:quinone reductase-like Zn-dependent oxidoreductase
MEEPYNELAALEQINFKGGFRFDGTCGDKQMKVFELQGGFGIENLAIVDRPDPKPGPSQALVQMKAWSLNYRDLMVVRGTYSPNLPLPFVTLSDGAGEIVAVGDDVSRVKVGDRVAAAFMQKWIEGPVSETVTKSALGAAIPGLAAEYVALDAQGLVSVPGHLSYEEAATLPCAAVTAWNALFASGNLKADDTVLIQGTGGVSLFALQFARLLAARVIATSSSDAKLARIQELGASDGINYKTTPEWGTRALYLTGGAGVDHVVEVGGAGTLAQSLKSVRMGGRISLIGVLTGGQIDPIPIIMKSVSLQGIFVGSREMFETMNRVIALNGLRPVIDRVFPFAAYPEALRLMESGAHFGKIVLAA